MMLIKGTESIKGYNQAVKNIHGLTISRKKRGITRKELSQKSGISLNRIYEYEHGKSLPTIGTYNKLCKVFKWQELTVSPQKESSKTDNLKILDDLLELEAVKLPKPVSFHFAEGHDYIVLATKGGESEPIKDCIFRYKGKQGIHHMFSEVHGGWTRTYTDAQLIGKIIKEVKA